MRKALKRIISLVLCMVFALYFTGCSKEETVVKANFVYPDSVKNEKSDIVSENENFALEWNKETYQVQMIEKSSGRIWSNIPQVAPEDNIEQSKKKNNPKIESPIFVTYYDKTNYNENTVIAKTAALNRGKVSSKKIDNGISVTYFFKKEEFSVTVDYTLRDDNMLVSVDTSKIKEGENVLVEKVSIAPYFCGIKNESEDTYLFMPSGSGTLVYPTITASVPTVVNEPVYGADYADLLRAKSTLSESVRLPVYGAKKGDMATLAIIEQSADCADITVSKNDSNVGFATVYGSFTVRGYTKIEVPRNFASAMNYMKLYAEPTRKVMSIAFYPLSGEDADYTGMANKYREYLTKKAGLKKTKLGATPLEIKFVGGALLKDHFLGISYKKLKVITSLEQVKDTINKLKDKYEFTVGLYGYGKSGLDVGKPAGALTVNSKLGGESDLKDMLEFCNDEKIPLYMNFDLLRFDTSGSGISNTFDTAVKTNGRRALLYHTDFVTAEFKETEDSYYLVTRDSLEKLSEKLLDKISGWKMTGIGLDTLSNMKYSDYSDEKYYFNGNSEKQVEKIIDSYKSEKIDVYTVSANAFAAAASDSISDTPVNSSLYDIYDCDIPFYQMVFSGIKNLYTPSVNLSVNDKKIVLKAVEGGCGLTYTIGSNFDNTLLNSTQKALYGSDINYVLKEIDGVMENGFNAYYKNVLGKRIVKHSVINHDVRCTEYENGYFVYVNYSDVNYIAENIDVPANGYLVVKGE